MSIHILHMYVSGVEVETMLGKFLHAVKVWTTINLAMFATCMT